MIFPKVFIGFDSRTPAAFIVQRYSIHQRSNGPVMIRPLIRQLLQLQGIYDRPEDPLASTEFTYTRFLVPFLTGYTGVAAFMDGDMLIRDDLRHIFELVQGSDWALACVKHDHRPAVGMKHTAGGLQKQTNYPRKNWSSMMVFNCAHPACRGLTPEYVNQASPAELHQFAWVDEKDILGLDITWNWLEGWNTLAECPNPAVVHYTRGIPGIHEGFSAAPFADEYISCINGTRTEWLL